MNALFPETGTQDEARKAAASTVNNRPRIRTHPSEIILRTRGTVPVQRQLVVMLWVGAVALDRRVP